nr:hypothetical protein [Tanacetum cinerariifolium]
MEIIDANKIVDEALISDDHLKISNPGLGGDVGSGNEGGVTVVKTTTIVERTKISVVETVREDKGDVLMKGNEGEGHEGEKNELEGLFGDLVDGEFLASDNGSDVELVVEGGTNEGNLADENEGRDMMDVRLSGEKEKNGEEGAEVVDVEAKEEVNKNGEGSAKSIADIFDWNEDVEIEEGKVAKKKDNGRKLAEKEEEKDEEDEMEEDHDFVVGDFVWGKIKHHPWWPGQIYDPSDASDHAATLKRNGRLLVAYFGDGSFSWCSPSQLKPFVDNFQEMSVQSDSHKFVNAVQMALEQVSKLVQAELMCKCQNVDEVENACHGNSGIKDGASVPKGNTIKVLMDRIVPVELLSTLQALVTMDPGMELPELELTVLKTCLRAFYMRKGGYVLPEYQNPKYIEGLEDENIRENVADHDMNGPSENKSNQKRKQKSVAELLGDDEPKVKKAKSSLGIKRERKRKPLVVSVTPESDHESGDGVDLENGGGFDEDMVSPRQRKKSKYLSPPYYSPVVDGKLSGLGSFKEPKSEGDKLFEIAAKQPEDSSTKSCGKRSRQKKSQQEHKTTIDGDVNVENVLNGLLRAALDPAGFVEKTLPSMTNFISSFRGSIFEEGSKSNDQNDGVKDATVKDAIVTTLVIEFPPEVALPTKPELSKLYKKFDLIKKETYIDGSSAFVVFGNLADAEAALAMSLEKKPSGDVKYHLISEEAVPRVRKGSRKSVAGDTSDLEFIEQKLEAMSETVKKCEANEMNAEVKASLEGGIKEVLEKVGKMKANSV